MARLGTRADSEIATSARAHTPTTPVLLAGLASVIHQMEGSKRRQTLEEAEKAFREVWLTPVWLFRPTERSDAAPESMSVPCAPAM